MYLLEGRAFLMTQPIFVRTDWIAERLMDSSIALVDARPPFFYAQGHIPGAISVPLFLLVGAPGRPDVAATATRLGRSGIGPGDHVVLYDDGASPTAAHAAWVLHYLGHGEVSVIEGGITKWANEGKDIDDGSVTREPVVYRVPEPDRSVLGELEDVLRAAADPETVVVDVRTPAEYLGFQMTARRNGHIPGAVNVDWSNNLEMRDGIAQLREDDALRRLYSEAGVTPDKRVVVHCQSGSRSTFTWLTLKHLGFDNVSNYAAGWQEWGNLPDTPIDEQ
jgi:thiosulfate/3-mercaptopyruvate sulfurtransferase